MRPILQGWHIAIEPEIGRTRRPFARARELNTIIFDKTGTLTEGGFSITDTITNGKRRENEK